MTQSPVSAEEDVKERRRGECLQGGSLQGLASGSSARQGCAQWLALPLIRLANPDHTKCRHNALHRQAPACITGV